MTDIRTAPASPELDLLFASVVGIPLDDNFPPSPGVIITRIQIDPKNILLYYYPDKGHRDVVRWRPSTSIGQAIDFGTPYLDSLPETGWRLQRNVIFKGIKMQDYAFICYSASPEMPGKTIFAAAPTAALAFVRGILLVAESLDKPAA